MLIYHISDIHIGNENRFEEIIQMVNQIVYYVPNNNRDVCVVTGDIFNVKDKFTPGMIMTCKQVFTILSSKLHVIVIDGNHDIYDKRTDKIPILRAVLGDMPNV